MKTKIAVISDLHYSRDPTPGHPQCKGEYADSFLLRLVHRINRWIKPDITVVLGDLVDESKAADTFMLLEKLRAILDLLESPVIVISGNHDPVPDKFYEVFRRPEAFVEAGGSRFVAFPDDRKGSLVVSIESFGMLACRIGALHRLSESGDFESMKDEFLFLTKALVSSGIHILAHPFRIFRRMGSYEPDRSLYRPVVGMLREHGVVAEINYHTNEPTIDFVKMCLAVGVKLSFRSDAHNLYEIGDFHPHLALLREAGCKNPGPDVLFTPADL